MGKKAKKYIMHGSIKRRVRLRKSRGPAPAEPKPAAPLPAAGNWTEQIAYLDGRGPLEHGSKEMRAYEADAHERVFGERPTAEALRSGLAHLRTAYELQFRGFKKNGQESLLSDKFLKRREAVLAGDLSGLDPRARQIFLLTEDGEPTMAKAKSKKATAKEPRATISALVQEILRRKVVPPTDDVVAEVKKSFPDSAFSRAHFSWYKNQFQQGKLAGQTKKEPVNQPDSGTRRAKAEKKPKGKRAKKAGKPKAKKVRLAKAA